MLKRGNRRVMMTKYKNEFGFSVAAMFWLPYKQKTVKRFAEGYLHNRSSKFN